MHRRRAHRDVPPRRKSLAELRLNRRPPRHRGARRAVGRLPAGAQVPAATEVWQPHSAADRPGVLCVSLGETARSPKRAAARGVFLAPHGARRRLARSVRGGYYAPGCAGNPVWGDAGRPRPSNTNYGQSRPVLCGHKRLPDGSARCPSAGRRAGGKGETSGDCPEWQAGIR